MIKFHAVMIEAILLQLNPAPVKDFTTTSLRTPDNKTLILIYFIDLSSRNIKHISLAHA